MKKLLICLICFLSCMAGCTQREPASEKGEEPMNNNTALSLEEYTQPVPPEYTTPANTQGSVVPFSYTSMDYVNKNTPITKTAYVYLPYGYDDNDLETRYTILYLMHGWTGHAGEYFEYGNVKNIIDHMIENKDIPPMIIVSPTFYAPADDNGFNTSVTALHAFHNDFRENLMPSVETAFHTYALSSSDFDLQVSRQHRIFGGFSLGSVTTWLELCYDYDYIYYYLPMSGSCWYYGTYGDFQTKRNVDFIEDLIKENDLNSRGYYIYHTTGTNDSVKSQSIMQAEEMLSRDTFNGHYVFKQQYGGYHDYNTIEEYLYNALPTFFKQEVSSELFSKESTIEEVINDPAFNGFGHLLFPVDQWYMSGNTLQDLSLTWYSNVDADKTVAIVNDLKQRSMTGETVFYDIYTQEEKNADPAKEDTGIFFFKGEPYAKTAICNAGGGFAYVGAMHDSFPHALELSRRGYNVFALIYRPGAETACEDLARTIEFLFEYQEELQIDMSHYSLWGGSAGARMAAWLGSFGTAYFGEPDCPAPAAVIMQYTGLSEVYGNEPPTYNCVGTNDGIASYRTMQRRINAIKANGTDAEIEIFPGLAHGFGLGTGTIAEGWIDHAIEFWERNS